MSPKIVFPDLSCTVSQYFMTLALMAVRQEVNNFEISVVVQELEFAMNLTLYVDYISLCFGIVGFILSYSENIIPLKLTLEGVARFSRFISLEHLDISSGFDEI